MAKCSVFNCLNSVINCPEGITFHRFPKDEPRRQKWILAVQREDWTPSAYSVVCSAHFSEKDVDRTSLMCVRIRQDAVPTVFASVSKYAKETKSRRKKPPDRNRKKPLRRGKIEQDCIEKQQADYDPRLLYPEECLFKVCDVRTCEPALGPDMSTACRDEDSTRKQKTGIKLLERCEATEGLSVLMTNAADNRTEQEPVANLPAHYGMTTCTPALPLTMPATGNGMVDAKEQQPDTMILGLLPLGTCVQAAAATTIASQHEDEAGNQKPVAQPGQCDADMHEPVLTSAMSTTNKGGDGSQGQQPVAKLLGLIAVGGSEGGSAMPIVSEGEVCAGEQSPVAVLLGLIAVGACEPTAGQSLAPASNCTMTRHRSVMCTPHTRGKVSFKRKLGQSNEQETEALRKMPMQEDEQDEVWDRWNLDQQVAADVSIQMPEAAYLLDQYDAGTCSPGQATSVTGDCTTSQDFSLLGSPNASNIYVLGRKLSQANEQLRIARKKIKVLLQSQRRCDSKIASLKNELSDLRSRNFPVEENSMPMTEDASSDFFERNAAKVKDNSLSTKYSAQLREFATKLFCYSPDAYNYMRETFHGFLPHPRTLQKWDKTCTHDSSEFHNS